MDTTAREKLTRPFPREAVKQREAPGGKKLDYVAGHTVIHRLNDAAPMWDMTIKDLHTSVVGKDREGDDILLVRAHVALTIPGMGTREHIGVQSVRARAGEDLIKGAVTDALKKAATLFGVGLELYGPDYEDDHPPVPVRQSAQPPAAYGNSPNTIVNGNGQRPQTTSTEPMTDRQLKMIWRTAGDKGIDSAALHAFIKEAYGGDSVDILSKRDASALIDLLMNNPQRVFNAALTVPANDDPYP